ncbi:MAG TPA: PEP-CTERM sorting domain-containing protein [Candidatus Acidoferrum sp.]|nr:PEP-CTERM sorting domain-containing protein [Candidatus Acidoferrum sp.]
MKVIRSVGLLLLFFVSAVAGGPGTTAARADDIATFDVVATGTCSSSPCGSQVSISGTFTVDLTTGDVSSGTMTMSDSADLAASSVSLPFNLQGPFLFDEFLFFRQPTGTGNVSYVELILPFSSFPGAYSGGPLCTAIVPGCGVISGAGIGPSDQSSSLLATTGGSGDTIVITSGSVTEAPEPSVALLLSGGLLGLVLIHLRRKRFIHYPPR